MTQGPHVSSDVDVNTRLGPVIPVIFLPWVYIIPLIFVGADQKKAWETCFFLSKSIYSGYT